MLLSPGHSPRRFSPSPSPSLHTPEPDAPTLGGAASASAVAVSKKRQHQPAVLDEDTYVAAIERIIERDFFPDLPRVRDGLELLAAARSGDPSLLRDAQLKIISRSTHGACPSTDLVTPFTLAARAAGGGESVDYNRRHGDVAADGAVATDSGPVDDSLQLDEFLRRYTSEDNESFNKIIEKVNRKKKEKSAHLYIGEAERVLSIEEEKRDRITDGYGTSGQPLATLEGCKFKAKNLLFYPIEGGEAPLTDDELAQRIKQQTKEIERSNTRFRGKPASELIKEAPGAEILYAPVAGLTPSVAAYQDAEKGKKYDLEDLRKTPNPFYVESDKKVENGYRYVKTPSPAPGVRESPFMTWGEIEGTPLRLNFEDLVPSVSGSGDGPQFNIPQAPVRDVKAHELSREAAKKIKERSRKFKKPPLPFASPVRSGSASPSVRTFSPAAQMLVRNAIAKSSHSIDETLRASYRGASPAGASPKTRFSTDTSLRSRSPSARQNSATPW